MCFPVQILFYHSVGNCFVLLNSFLTLSHSCLGSKDGSHAASMHNTSSIRQPASEWSSWIASHIWIKQDRQSPDLSSAISFLHHKEYRELPSSLWGTKQWTRGKIISDHYSVSDIPLSYQSSVLIHNPCSVSLSPVKDSGKAEWLLWFLWKLLSDTTWLCPSCPKSFLVWG